MVLNDCFFGMLCYSNYRNLAVCKQVYGLVFQSFTENLTFSYHILFWGYMNVNSDWKGWIQSQGLLHNFSQRCNSYITRRLVKVINTFFPWARQTQAKIPSSGCQYIDYNEKIKFCHKGENLSFLKQSVFFLLTDKSEKTNQNWRMWNGDSEQGQLD